jgi:hypothetical protein
LFLLLLLLPSATWMVCEFVRSSSADGISRISVGMSRS